jgi:hypothetical protein
MGINLGVLALDGGFLGSLTPVRDGIAGRVKNRLTMGNFCRVACSLSVPVKGLLE